MHISSRKIFKVTPDSHLTLFKIKQNEDGGLLETSSKFPYTVITTSVSQNELFYHKTKYVLRNELLEVSYDIICETFML